MSQPMNQKLTEISDRLEEMTYRVVDVSTLEDFRKLIADVGQARSEAEDVANEMIKTEDGKALAIAAGVLAVIADRLGHQVAASMLSEKYHENLRKGAIEHLINKINKQ